MRTTKEDLQCKVLLTDEDVIKYSRESAAAKSKQTRIEGELKFFTAMKKAEIQKEESTVLINSEKINN